MGNIILISLSVGLGFLVYVSMWGVLFSVIINPDGDMERHRQQNRINGVLGAVGFLLVHLFVLGVVLSAYNI